MTAYASNATGTWSTPTIWTPNGTPGNGDTISIGAGHTVTMDSSRTIGTSGVAGTVAVTIANTGVLSLSSGTLTLRGDITIAQGDGFVLGAGTTLSFDSSASASPSTTAYKVIAGTTHFDCHVVVNGTSGSHVTINSVKTSSAKNGYFAATGFLASGLIRGSYCDMTNVGDSTNPAMSPSPSSATAQFSLTNFVLDSCGNIHKEFGINAAATYSLVNVTMKNTLASQCLQLENTTAAKTTGTRVVSGCVFDKICYLYFNAGFVVSNTVFLNGFGTIYGLSQGATYSNCFILQQTALGDEIVLNGDLDSSYCYFNTTNINPHFFNVLANQSESVTNNIFEASNSAANCEGDCLILGAPASAATLTVTGNIILPNAGDITTGTLFTSGTAGGSNVTIIANRNTVHSGGSPGVQQGAAVGETYTGHTGMISSFKNNIFWTKNTTGGYKLYDSGVDDVVSDLVTSANANYNCGYNLSAGSNLKGYDKLQFSSGSPGANDIDIDPRFVDPTRDLGSWSFSINGGTANDAITALALKNTPSYDSRFNIADLITYVRNGFKIRAGTLKTGGSDGSYIGAMPGAGGPESNFCGSDGFNSP